MKSKLNFKVIVTVLFLILFLLMYSLYSYAATTGSFSVSSSNQSLNPGETATVTISVSKCEGEFTVRSSDTNVVVVSTDSVWVSETGNTVTLTAKGAGNATITIEALDVADNQADPQAVIGTKDIAITVTNPAPEPTQATTQETTPAPVSDSTTYTDVNETVYGTTSGVNIRNTAVSGDPVGTLSKAEKLTRTGIGNNGWSRVSYNGSVAYIRSDFLSTSAPSGSSDANLKSLTVSTGALSPSFSSGTNNYSMTVDSKVESVTVNATPSDGNASVSGTGKINLKDGTNQVRIVVTAENGTTNTYKINISKMVNEGTKPGNLLEGQAIQLKELSIEGVTLSPAFSPEVFSYTATISDEKMADLKILSATPNQEGITVEIVGDKGLIAGENILTIILKSPDGTQAVTYQVIINKEGTAVTEVTKTTGVVNQSNMKDTIMKLPLKSKLIIAGIILITLVIIILLIVKYIRDKRDEEEDFRFGVGEKNEEDDDSFSFEKEYTKEDFMRHFENESDNSIDVDEEMNENTVDEPKKVDYSFEDNYEIDEKMIEFGNEEKQKDEEKIGIDDIDLFSIPKKEMKEEDNFEEDIYTKISNDIDNEIGGSGILDDGVRYGMRKNKRSGNKDRGRGRHF